MHLLVLALLALQVANHVHPIQIATIVFLDILKVEAPALNVKANAKLVQMEHHVILASIILMKIRMIVRLVLLIVKHA